MSVSRSVRFGSGSGSCSCGAVVSGIRRGLLDNIVGVECGGETVKMQRMESVAWT
jgi:diaminopimelate epimerase